MEIRQVYLDFETFYDTASGYTLKKMTTEEYLRDPRFEILMVTIKINTGKTYAVHGHDAVMRHIRELQLDKPGTVVYAHNARFDASIIEWIIGVKIFMVICSIYMMRQTGLSRIIRESLSSLAQFLHKIGHNIPLKKDAVKHMNGKRYADLSPAELNYYTDYAITDTDILAYAVNLMLPLCSSDSLQAMNMTLQMYTRPVLQLNQKLLSEYLEGMRLRREEALSTLAAQYNFSNVMDFLKHIRSAKKFAALLEELGVAPPKKISVKKSEKYGYDYYDYAFAKTDLAFQALASHPDIRVASLVQARLNNNSSIAESRTEAFLSISRRGLLPVPLEYAGAHPGRYSAGNRDEEKSGDKTNVQNLPKRGGDKTLRTSIEAPDYHLIGAADSSQVEARVLAYAAQERDLLNIFETGGDPYSVMAGRIYGVSADLIYYWSKGDGAKKAEAGDEEAIKLNKLYTGYRNVGKETILGSGYQMSGAKFANRLKQQKIILQPTVEQIAEWEAAWSLANASGFGFDSDNQFAAAKAEWIDEFHLNEAKRINRIYRQTNSKIKNFWVVCQNVLDWMLAGSNGYFGGPDGTLFYFDGQHEVFGQIVPGIMLPDGYWILYPELRKYYNKESGWWEYTYKYLNKGKVEEKFIYGGAVTENLMQGLAFAILKWQGINIHLRIPLCMNVHDEWAAVIHQMKRDYCETVMLEWMRRSPPWCPDVPLDCEFKAGTNYGAC